MARSDFAAGVRAVLPFVPGYIPYGIIVGVTAQEIGMNVFEASAMSALIYGGAAQLAAIELMAQGAPFGVIVFTALLINLRLLMFSAAIEPYLRSYPRSWKWLGGFIISTPAYIVSAAELDPDNSAAHRWFYVGAAIPVYVSWVGSTMIGAVLGGEIPTDLRLGFALPLVFIFMLFEVVDDRRTLFAAVTGGTVAVGAVNLPLNLGIVIATCIGMSAGLIADWGGEHRDDV